MERLIVPSILSADMYDLRSSVETVQGAGARMLHVDVMDGRFVPNLSFGMPIVRSLSGHGMELDVHLMIAQPENYIQSFVQAGADWLTVHAEAVPAGNLRTVLYDIRLLGARAGVSIRPDTPIETVAEFIKYCDLLLVMTVPPGFGAQKFDKNSPERIRRARELIDEMRPECRLSVDGGINLNTIGAALQAGADTFVAGSAVFDKSDPGAAFRELSEKIGGKTHD